MNKPYEKIFYLILLIILLPAGILSFYQISSLNQNEKNIQKVYNNELKTILLSLNEYSTAYIEDLTRNFVLMTLEQKKQNPKYFSFISKEFLIQNNFIELAMTADTNFSKKTINISSIISSDPNYKQKNINKLLILNKVKIKNLFKPDSKVYRGHNPFISVINGKLNLLVSPVTLPVVNGQICALLINPELFINQILSNRIKEISQNEFLINISNTQNGKIVYKSGNFSKLIAEQTANLVISPNYEISINLKGMNIPALVKSRMLKNLFLILVINLFIIIGLWFVLKNFKREKELAKLQADFISYVSHELRTPLSLIGLFSETLLMGKIDDKKKKAEYYNVIYEESSRLSRLVEKILSFYSLKENKKTYNFTKENLNFVIENILDKYKTHLDNNKFKVIFIPNKLIPDISIDKDSVVEVIINLIDNAMKYSTTQKQIDISTGIENDFLFINVKDYGIGISNINQRRIFEKYYRITNDSLNLIKGTGLGLSIAKEIMKTHNGKILVESSEGKGSCFILKFPVN